MKAAVRSITTSGGNRIRKYFADAAEFSDQWRNTKIRRDDDVDQSPLRAEIFSTDQMEQHGKALARSHVLSRSASRDRLLARLDENEQVIEQTCSLLTNSVKAKSPITPASEWLLDNFPLIEEQIRTARQHLPKRYSRELPCLAQGASQGLPRVYDLALEAIAHGDGRVDAEALGRFVAAYQTVTELTLGELWAIPIMLRLALIENLRRLAAQISTTRIYLNQAQAWADQMTEIAESDPTALILVIADMARSDPPMVSAFVAELTRRLQGRGPALALPLTWIEQRLVQSSRTIEQMVHAENQRQAADQVSISNTIGSLRFLGRMDWRLFVETMSVVEQILLKDRGDVYRAMDFETRDRYRHVIDRLAKRGHIPESEVAQAAITLAQQNTELNDKENHTAHVGYYLIDHGRAQLEKRLSLDLPLLECLSRVIHRNGLMMYLGSILLMTLMVVMGLVEWAFRQGLYGWPLIVLCGLSFLAASQFAAALTNWLTTLLVTPQRLPQMDLSKGLPARLRTLVVVPTLLRSVDEIEALLEAIEVRFLGNRDDCLHFALLTDLCDAREQRLPEDAALLAIASKGIEKLNAKYRSASAGAFLLLHRERCWNARDNIWMGYERKRGKLLALNALLRDENPQAFSLIVGDVAELSGVKYVITLDADTQLPRESALKLIGAMAHPLNHARFDANKRRVVGGYGILQPRMASSMIGARRSRYAQLFCSEPGIDPYTRSVSDVYQDAFGEGSFIGKGIYDVEAVDLALKHRFPENRILSHDLLEGCYARSGLLNDVELFEDHPAQYQTDVNRHRRWIRGDWQIAQWLMPSVPTEVAGETQPNPLSILSRWKILDNLRRSLAHPAGLFLLLWVWIEIAQPLLWTIAVLGFAMIPPLLIATVSIFRKPKERLVRAHLADTFRSAGFHLALAGFSIACLPFEACFSLEAICRTIWRVNVSRRHLLEWKVFDEKLSRADASVIASYRTMWIAPVTAFVAAFALSQLKPHSLWIAAPILALWLAAPWLAFRLSQPLQRSEATLTSAQTLFLRRMARKTWAFFDRFVAAEDHWLPPDNYQENPEPVIAHRTSPTNMGLALLANLSACDFGFIAAGSLIARTENAFRTMKNLERHQGHFYNWYDTRTLQPLAPRYISSVDSGNLAGHLLTFGAGLVALPDQKIIGTNLFDGLMDTLAVLADSMPEPSEGIVRLKAMLIEACNDRSLKLRPILQLLESIAEVASRLNADPKKAISEETAEWQSAFVQQVSGVIAEIQALLPWSKCSERPAELNQIDALDDVPGLRALAEGTARVFQLIEAPLPNDTTPEQLSWRAELRRCIASGREQAQARIAAIDKLQRDAADFAAMEYEFLYDASRHVLAIGYNVDEFRRDTSFYDLLASEARLCSFVAIAQGKLPQESWFALGRLQTIAGHEPILVSWSGSMFEYLMPLLVMPTYEGTLLDQTCRAAVARQMDYGNQRAVPWGVSESGYNTVDASLNYQYHAFGVPGLGFKRGLAEDLVVAPYASALALMVAPQAACANLQRLAAGGLEGQFGFFEAIDYTPSRLTRGQSGVIVRSFMAHHQSMTLLSLAHLLLDRPMQRRFESDPNLQSTLLLLQERIPKTSVSKAHAFEHSERGVFADASQTSARLPIGAFMPTPEVQLMSNGRYQVMVTNTGGGYSQWQGRAITRWREDSTRDHWGSFLYLRDVQSGEFWSNTYQPTLKRAESYEAIFSEGRAEYRRRDHDYETYTEIVVSPEDDIELRRIRITNRAHSRRTIEITSYAEVVLAAPEADIMQPSFGNLFVQTELIADRRAILCTRRPRSIGEPTPWMFHLLAAHGTDIGQVSYETDRMRFTGRGRTLGSPRCMNEAEALSGTAGSVLDPIVAIRCRITLKAEQSVVFDLVTGVAENREACLALVDRYQDRHLADRVFDLAWTHGGVTLRQLNATESDAQLYRRLAGSVLYANAALRAENSVLVQNRRGQSGLWGYGISGDLPIVLVKIADRAHIELARQMIQCHAYWRQKGLVVDLVIWNKDHNGYRQQLQDQIMGLIATGVDTSAVDRPGGIFVRSAEQISTEDRILLESVARVVLADSRGTLLDQIVRRSFSDKRVARLARSRSHRPEPSAAPELPRRDLILNNPLGGFTADGREYIITTAQAQMTPLPWVNVLANAGFGTVVSESGLAYTWSENAHEFRLTPWSDDPVGTSGGEAIYLRDEESGHFWSPSPLPTAGAMPYVTRHGFGYSVFEHTTGGIRSELWIYVDLEESVKFSVLKVRNGSGRTRHLSATGYVEWVLGDLRSKSGMHVVTGIDSSSGALFASNAYNTEFAGRVAFIDVDDDSRTLTGDRTEFLGRDGSLADPDAMTRAHLSGRVGAALDPCGAIQVPFDLMDGQERQIIFRLGTGHDIQQARELALRLRKPGTARAALEKVHQYWRRTLGAVQVETPDASLNVMANGWLLYQTLACRLWARSGFYQSGGAFGFRDQLQDAMALVHAEPRLLREHLLRCAARQYPQGDVQHWWHPPSGRGVRTRCSDDYLWLPLATCRYVFSSGDHTVLDEPMGFLEGRDLGADEESYYDLPGRSSEEASLYQHGVRAIRHGLRFGEHGLPLMGSGDWNDGMNLVGIQGKGESVWLGFFLYDVLQSFAVLASDYGDADFARECRASALQLRENLARHAWDGQWYRRAYFDDGSPLGSSINPECSIDSIAQSWSVLSGAGQHERAPTAMDALYRRLVRRGPDHADGLIQLLDPPFDKSAMNPGYIKGYVPGVRENGGQYTHAAVWAAMAFAALGDSRRAWELLALINPANHTLNAKAVAIYKTEPYVVAADVYALAPHTGRGGWTWYTGSAGWLYRLIIESLLGIKREGSRLSITACIPEDWSSYSLSYRYLETSYRIQIVQSWVTDGVDQCRITVDGLEQRDHSFQLVDDRVEHAVRVELIRTRSKPLPANPALSLEKELVT